ncbi:MAG: hypothetical protein DLM61_06135 [Pseudonocardiales bacterium]|nr:MAG: hypothetical protein DLM61_06135 [Pseudonocardiales bacterium]
MQVHTVQVLIDADNLDVPRLRLLVAALEAAPSGHVVIAGAPAALEALDWPPQAQVLPASGWQGADIVLARAYRTDDRPLLLATGDGDFAQLARRHPGIRASPQPTPPPTVGHSCARGWTGTRCCDCSHIPDTPEENRVDAVQPHYPG